MQGASGEGAGLDRYEDHVILSFKRKLSYAWTGLGDGLLNDTVNNALMLYYNTVLMLDGTSVGLALFIPRAWDMISDPLMGHLSDNTRSRWGRRRPYLLIGSFLMSAAFFSIWIPWDGLSQRGLFWYLLVTAFLYYTFYTVTLVPSFALGAELSVDYHERTRLNSYRGFMNRIGGLLGGCAWPIAASTLFASVQFGFRVVAGIYAVASVLFFVWAFLGTSENAELQNREKEPFFQGFRETFGCRPLWILAGIILFLMMGVLIGFPAQYYLIIYYLYGGDKSAAAPLMAVSSGVFAAVCTLGVFPVTWLGLRIGKERAMFAGTILFTAAPLLSWFAFRPAHPYLMLLFTVPVALALASVMIFMNAMLADLVDLDEVKTYKRREGSYSAVMSFIFKLPGPIGTLAFGFLLDHFAHFNQEAAAQTPEVLRGLRLILCVFPLACFALASLLSYIYPVREEQIREVRALLEERRVARESV